jgi:hypothetical protein
MSVRLLRFKKSLFRKELEGMLDSKIRVKEKKFVEVFRGFLQRFCRSFGRLKSKPVLSRGIFRAREDPFWEPHSPSNINVL